MLLDDKVARSWVDFQTTKELFDAYPSPPDDNHASQIIGESDRSRKLFVGFIAKGGKWVKFSLVNLDAYDIEHPSYTAIST